MALNFDAKYTPRSKAADADYSYGSFKNSTTPLTGTPLDKDWANDFLGFFQKLLDYAVITPSGVPDTILASDFFDALVKRIKAQSQYLVDSGAADAYVVGGDPAYAAYTAGMKIRVKIANINTGASTINVDSLGAKNIVKYVGTALVAGDLPVGAIAEMQYDGTNFQLQHVHNINPTLASFILTGVAASPPVANALTKEGIPKAWWQFNGVGTPVFNDELNMDGFVDNGVGDYTLNVDTDMVDGNYSATVWGRMPVSFLQADAAIQAGSIRIITQDNTFTNADFAVICGQIIGRQ